LLLKEKPSLAAPAEDYIPLSLYPSVFFFGHRAESSLTINVGYQRDRSMDGSNDDEAFSSGTEKGRRYRGAMLDYEV